MSDGLIKEFLRAFVVICLLTESSFCLAKGIPKSCKTALRTFDYSEDELYFKYKERDNGNTRISIRDEDGNKRGYLDYRYYRDMKRLDIFEIHIKKEYRRQGYSTYLLAEAVRLNPSLKEISTLMALTNDQIFMKAYLKKHMSSEEAVMLTPAYRARAAIGFGRIISVEPREPTGFFQLIVGRD